VKPTALIATTARWNPTARLAASLADAGFTVDAVCPSDHPIAGTGVARKIYPYHGFNPLNSFAAAISASHPDLLISGDDLATQHLHALHQREATRGDAGKQTRSLIERSLGAAENFPIVYSRTEFIDIARSEGVRVPQGIVIRDLAELKAWVGRAGLPTVLKSDGSSGGDGVRVANSWVEAERAFRMLQAPPLFARAAKRAVFDHDVRLLWPSISRQRCVVNAQSYVAGCEATSAVACWNGEVLAALHFEVVMKGIAAGPASVLKLIDNPEMSETAVKMARRLKLSGMHGFDYMLESKTGDAYLIEINPRSTQVGHLTLGLGRDIPAALYAAVTAQPIRPSPKITEDSVIALFPQEWTRDPASPYLQSAYHDVPWDKPDLILACVRARRKQDDWYLQQNELQAYSVARSSRA
jgi:Carbamoyl-phosphate synthase L chain, ATP binding domain